MGSRSDVEVVEAPSWWPSMEVESFVAVPFGGLKRREVEDGTDPRGN